MEGDSKKLEKEMSGKGSAEKLPPAKGKHIDSEADVKKKDGACYKKIEQE